jgi:hypothetical protein
MPAGPTYEPIATQTLGSPSTSITFSSIPSTYTDLILVVSGPSADTGGYGITLNGDTGTNYSRIYLYANGSSTASGITTNFTSLYQGGNGPLKMGIHQIFNYSNSTTYKTMFTRYGATTDYGTVAFVGTWRNTAVVTSLSILNGGSGFSTGCMFTLYGIKAA